MVVQQRAARTRRDLVHAAASEIDRAGYEGATLSRICKSAAVSMGALTFHFSSKNALADAVQAAGTAIVQSLMDEVVRARQSALQSVIDLTVGLAGLLENEVVVRSSARLAEERPGASDCWMGAWFPVVCELLDRAREDGQLRATEPPQTATALVVYLLAGAQSHVRATAAAPDRGVESAADQLEQIWRLALSGIASESVRPTRRTPV